MPTITQDIVSGWIKAADGGLSNLELAQKAAEWGAGKKEAELRTIRKLHDSTLLIAQELQKELKQLQTQLAVQGTADLAEPHCAKWPKCGCPHVYECINGN